MNIKITIASLLVGVAASASAPAHAGWKFWETKKEVTVDAPKPAPVVTQTIAATRPLNAAKPAAATLAAAKPTAAKPTAAKPAVAPREVDAIFLHGLGASPKYMPLPGLVRSLHEDGLDLKIDAPWLRPVVIDEDGYTRQTGTHTMTDQLARARAAIAKHEGKVVLFGHSFGGKAAIALAKEMPDKVKGVVLFAPSVKMLYSYWKNLTGERGLPEKSIVVAKLAAHEASLRKQLDSLDEDSYKRGSIRSELSYLATMQDLVQHDETQMELGVKVPMLMLHGEDDNAVSIHYARRFAEANPSVKFVEYPGVGHGLEGSRSAEKDMAARINTFVRSLEEK